MKSSERERYTLYKGGAIDLQDILDYVPKGKSLEEVVIIPCRHSTESIPLIEIAIRLPLEEATRRREFASAIRAIDIKGSTWDVRDVVPNPQNYGLRIGHAINKYLTVEKLPNGKRRWQLKAEAVYNYIQKLN